MFLPLPQQQALQKNQILVRSVRAEKCSSGKKKYQETYLERGFTYSIVDGEQCPQCLICYEILANDSMKPLKLKRRMATKHVEFKNKPIKLLRGNCKACSSRKC
jgi:hypothetical protein